MASPGFWRGTKPGLALLSVLASASTCKIHKFNAAFPHQNNIRAEANPDSWRCQLPSILIAQDTQLKSDKSDMRC